MKRSNSAFYYGLDKIAVGMRFLKNDDRFTSQQGQLLAAVAPQDSTSFHAERNAFVNQCPLRLRNS
jgi:hypothetical protein